MGPDPFTNLTADCRVMDAAGLIAILVRGISHEISDRREKEVRNRSTAGCYNASFENFRAIAVYPQTGRRNVGSDLPLAIQKGPADLEAVPFGECGRLAGFNLGDRQSDDRSSEQRDDCQGREGYEHCGCRLLLVSTPPLSGIPINNNLSAK